MYAFRQKQPSAEGHNLEQLGSVHRSFKGVWALGDSSFKRGFYNAGHELNADELNYSPKDSTMDILSNTDSYSFITKNIPSVILGSGGFDEHHTTKDKIELIDFPHLQKAIKVIVNFIKDQY